MNGINFTVIGRNKDAVLEFAQDELAKNTNSHYDDMLVPIADSIRANVDLLTDNPTMSIQVTVQAQRGVIDGDPPCYSAAFLTVQAFYTSNV